MVYVKIHKLRDYVKGNTKSCKDLVNYLEKENIGKQLPEKEYFFNHDHDFVNPSQVIQSIDHNVKGLKKEEARFFMLTINPSQQELGYLARMASGREIEQVSDLSKKELDRYMENFKSYTIHVMNEYAHAFNRGIEKENLLYYIKIEQCRQYKGYDQEVKKGLAVTGEYKKGLQTHAHIIVSRRDIEMERSLSPLANSRGHSSDHQLNGRAVQIGFDRVQFKMHAERLFDEQFHYERHARERFLENLKNIRILDRTVIRAYIKVLEITRDAAWELEI